MKTMIQEDELLCSLAAAMYEHPRSTMKELADASKISKATLHRFCGSRENLEEMINRKAVQILDEIRKIAEAPLETEKNPIEPLIRIHLQNMDILRFYTTRSPCSEDALWQPFLKSIDTFFLNGQQKGFFRIDLSAPTLTELFESTLCAVYEGVKRGRIASGTAADAIESFFLHGATN